MYSRSWCVVDEARERRLEVAGEPVASAASVSIERFNTPRPRSVAAPAREARAARALGGDRALHVGVDGARERVRPGLVEDEAPRAAAGDVAVHAAGAVVRLDAVRRGVAVRPGDDVADLGRRPGPRRSPATPPRRPWPPASRCWLRCSARSRVPRSRIAVAGRVRRSAAGAFVRRRATSGSRRRRRRPAGTAAGAKPREAVRMAVLRVFGDVRATIARRAPVPRMVRRWPAIGSSTRARRTARAPRGARAADPARELRDLGDGWLLHDPNDAEPFWNRVIAPRWPAEQVAFDRRLDEVITLFATLGGCRTCGRSRAAGRPTDLADRLTAAGFQTSARTAGWSSSAGAGGRAPCRPRRGSPPPWAAGIRQATGRGRGPAAGPVDPPARSRIVAGRRTWPERRRWAAEASLVLAEAFGVGEARAGRPRERRPGVRHAPGLLDAPARVDGEPAAIARRASTDDGSYLSSIGTRPAFRGRGLGALVTLLAIRDALDAGQRRRPPRGRGRQRRGARPLRAARLRARRRRRPGPAAPLRPWGPAMSERGPARRGRAGRRTRPGATRGSSGSASRASAGRRSSWSAPRRSSRARSPGRHARAAWSPGPRDDLLGASAWVSREWWPARGPDDPPAVVLLEPDTEGPARGTLAKFDEGVGAVYLRAARRPSRPGRPGPPRTLGARPPRQRPARARTSSLGSPT